MESNNKEQNQNQIISQLQAEIDRLSNILAVKPTAVPYNIIKLGSLEVYSTDLDTAHTAGIILELINDSSVKKYMMGYEKTKMLGYVG